MICIIIATRSGATEFSGPMKLLKEMYSKASKDYLFEIVIRGDEDDKFFPKTVKDIKLAKFPFRIKFITGKRGRGYEDLHKFYNECLIESSGSQKIIFSLPEDVVINFNEWDKYIIKQYNLAKERFGHSYFTMHESTLPGICDNYEGTVESPDSFPIYSFDWMLCTGGFAHTGSNDSWVQVTHHMLLKKFGVHCRYFLPKRIFQRHTDSHDGISSRRWVNSRLRNHDLLRNKKVSMIINNHAKIIYQNIVFNTQNLSKNLNDVVYVQLAAEKYGSFSVFFKTMYIFFKKAPLKEIKRVIPMIYNNLNLFVRLKLVFPDFSQDLSDVYNVCNGEVKNIHRDFQSGTFASSNMAMNSFAPRLSKNYNSSASSEDIPPCNTVNNSADKLNKIREVVKTFVSVDTDSKLKIPFYQKILSFIRRNYNKYKQNKELHYAMHCFLDESNNDDNIKKIFYLASEMKRDITNNKGALNNLDLKLNNLLDAINDSKENL